MTARLPAYLALLPLCALLGVMACGGDGCGEDPKTQKAAPASSGGGVSGKSSGGGDVSLADWDGSRGNQAAAGAAQQAAAAKPPTAPAPAPAPAPLDEIAPASWGPLVVKSTGAVFVLLGGRSCPDCELVSPVLRRLASNFPAWSFYRLDVASKEAKTLLPKGMSPLPLPGFLIYDKGWPHSRRQGLPLRRGKGELDVDYQTRLARWFRDALTQKSFAFGARN